jgi:hypothetical protein
MPANAALHAMKKRPPQQPRIIALIVAYSPDSSITSVAFSFGQMMTAGPACHSF